MPSSYTPSLRLTLPADGELVGTWGQTVNNGITLLEEAAIAGTATVAMGDADKVLTIANGAADQARSNTIVLTGAMTAQRAVVCPSVSKNYFVRNNTTGGQSILFKTAAGTGVTIVPGYAALVYCDGVNVMVAANAFGDLSSVGTLTVAGTLHVARLTAGDLILGDIAAGFDAIIRITRTGASAVTLKSVATGATIGVDTAAGNTQRLFISTAGDGVFGDGILPADKLSVSSVQIRGLGVYRDFDVGAAAAEVQFALGARLGANFTHGAVIAGILDAGAGSGSMYLATRNANVLNPHLFILSNGNVGIGTPTPDSKLGLSGGALRVHYDRNTYPNIYGYMQHTGDARGLEIGNVNSSSNRSIAFMAGASPGTLSEKARIHTNGAFYINTADNSPFASVGDYLGVNGNIALINQINATPGAGGAFELVNRSSAGTVILYANAGAAVMSLSATCALTLGGLPAINNADRQFLMAGRNICEFVMKSNSPSGGTGASTIYFGNNATDGAGYINYNHNLNLLDIAVNNGSIAQRYMRINSNGDFGFGRDNGVLVSGNSCRFGMQYPGGGSLYGLLLAPTLDTTTAIVFANASGGLAGTINQTGNAISMVNGSDYRLKEGIADLTGSGDFLDALLPRTWTWINDGSAGVGFVAHEAQAVMPRSVWGEKDALNDDGTVKAQMLEYASPELIANLVAEVKALRQRVAALEV